MRLSPGPAAIAATLVLVAPAGGGGGTCAPTRADSLGPYYVPGAPVRAKTGSGYVLRGVVRSAGTCRPVARARIELWNAGPAGEYGARWRATTYAKADGSYRYETVRPPAYAGRPPHIHLRVSAPRHRPLVTQHYPRPGTRLGRMALVLLRA